MGLLDDAALNGYADALGQRLVKKSPRQDIPYQFHVVDMIEPNAFALPGGYVYVTRGLLALVNTEDELAGVVGHEIGHVAARHTVQRISRQGPFALITNLVSGVTGFFVPVVGNIVGGIGNFAQSLVFSPIQPVARKPGGRSRAGNCSQGWLGSPGTRHIFGHARARRSALERRPAQTQFF